MPLRFGPGPVFIHESIAACRRWQLYALRSLFVLGLLLALSLVLYTITNAGGGRGSTNSVRALANLGQQFYYAISTVQLVLVLLVAPAATAGAICVDRARGTLTHMLVTDLTELGNRAWQTGSAAACRVFITGRHYGARAGTRGAAGWNHPRGDRHAHGDHVRDRGPRLCACAGDFGPGRESARSFDDCIWNRSPLDPGLIVWSVLAEVGGVTGPPDWYVNINPFVLVWAPCRQARVASGIEFYALAARRDAVLLSGRGIDRLRRPSAAGPSRPKRPNHAFIDPVSWVSRARAWVEARRRSPSLDQDPVLWREWRRGRPSRLARIIWGFYFTLASAGTAWSIFVACDHGDTVTVGFLVRRLSGHIRTAACKHHGTFSAGRRACAPTSMYSLTTPVSTDRIVLAKWWGAYRVVPALAFLPAIRAFVVGFAEPGVSCCGYARARTRRPDPVGWIDRIAFVCLPTALFLARGPW